MAEKSHFIYLIRPVRPAMIIEPTPEEGVILRDHFNYLKQNLEAGNLVLAGPCTDGAFGIVIILAEDQAAAEAFMHNDPAVKNGVMTSELHAFRVALH